ncbi:hypothetical protein HF519_10080 [Pseudonocardia bannensis]|uniref:Oligosaccharide repeat unit polymerase n=1 Tax=Pseudonocardia bannensis TaxID=630973 RepID=A0A848DGZ2_9PSEU|nr:hypothetical protein [Pseudonocardia bannensis]
MEFTFPWWLHPISLVALVPLATALVSILLPESAYEIWRVRKHLDFEESVTLLVGLVSLFLGLILTSYRHGHSSRLRFHISDTQLRRLHVAYRWSFRLTVVGYVLWMGFAVASGVGSAQLLAVLEQQQGAISGLKENARPVGGLTTLTQFGSVTAVLGALLRRIDAGSRWYRAIIVFALFRALFYAERLALIEVVLPLIIFHVLTTESRPDWKSRVVRLLPLYAVPALWAVFGAFEYFRSWAILRYQTSESFFEFVSLRLLGYYVTSYNNSALFDVALQNLPGPQSPYQSFPLVWNAPGLSEVLNPPTYLGMSSGEWIEGVLVRHADPQFTNKGSFLLTHGEMGLVGMVLVWLITGLVIGSLYASIMRGNLGALLGYATVAIGLLELPRIIYWTEGRAFPVLIAVVTLVRILRPAKTSACLRSSRRPSQA